MRKITIIGALIDKAEAGDAEAQYEVGRRSRLGRQTAKKEKTAFKWLYMAAKQGHSAARRCLIEHPGYVDMQFREDVSKWRLEMAEKGDAIAQFQQGCFCGSESPESIKWFQKAINQDYLPAFVWLGDRLENGVGVDRDEKKAAELYRVAASRGDIEAQAALGVMYADGRGVVQDDAEAMKWLQRPLAEEMGIAWVALGDLHIKKGTAEDIQEAVKCYRVSAGYRCEKGAYRLGILYEKGQGVPQNYEEAAKWYLKALDASGQGRDPLSLFDNWRNAIRQRNRHRLAECKQAAEQGNSNAQVEYGLNTIGPIDRFTEEDLLTAQWFNKSAEQSNALGQFCWGLLISYSLVPGNSKGMMEWFRKAADQGLAEAQAIIAGEHRCASKYAEALKWYLLAAEQGQVRAQAELGEMFAMGQGVAQDFVKAAKWRRLAFEWDKKSCLNNIGPFLWERQRI